MLNIIFNTEPNICKGLNWMVNTKGGWYRAPCSNMSEDAEAEGVVYYNITAAS